MGLRRVSKLVTNLVVLHCEKHFCWRSRRKLIPWGLLVFLGLISLFNGHVVSQLERCSQRLSKQSLTEQSSIKWTHPQLDKSDNASISLWKSGSSNVYYGCSKKGHDFHSAIPEHLSNGYLLIETSGGLNQQRTGIIDAVVVARILNATLVIPELDHYSFWKDDSDFSDIFDVDWFITSLAKDVHIVKKIPDKVMRSLEKPLYAMRMRRKSSPKDYLNDVLPVLLRKHAVQLTKFDYRLANNLDDELQKLRCRVNYHALRFTKPIDALGKKLAMKMRKMAKHFIAVHLRFEPDMLAFSGCYYGGGDKERNELGQIRKQWPNLNLSSADQERERGKCLLTPYEVGLMLRALSFGNDTYLYVASGEIYGGEQSLQPLKDMFPDTYTKEMLAGEKLKPFLPYSSRLAAIDYVVSEDSDIFVPNNNGNMAKMLAGERLYMGSKRTIKPNLKKLNALFKAREQMDWHKFAKKVRSCQKDFMGEPQEMRVGRVHFYELPSSCICRKPHNKNIVVNSSDVEPPAAFDFLSSTGDVDLDNSRDQRQR